VSSNIILKYHEHIKILEKKFYKVI